MNTKNKRKCPNCGSIQINKTKDKYVCYGCGFSWFQKKLRLYGIL